MVDEIGVTPLGVDPPWCDPLFSFFHICDELTIILEEVYLMNNVIIFISNQDDYRCSTAPKIYQNHLKL